MVNVKRWDREKTDRGRTCDMHTVEIPESKRLKERQYLKS